MNNSIIIPDELKDQIEERAQLWLDKQSAQNHASKLKAYASHFNAPAQPLQAPLSHRKTPPAELEMVIPALEKELQKIQDEERHITRYRTEINELKSKAQTTLIMVIVGGVILLSILIAVLS